MKKFQKNKKQLETDIWIIALVTLGIFLLYASTGKQLMSFVTNSNISVILRLLLNASIQFGIAGLGITIVCILRKEKFTQFGLMRKNIGKAIIGTIVCFIPSICYIFVSGRFNEYQPFSILITNDVLASGISTSILGIFSTIQSVLKTYKNYMPTTPTPSMIPLEIPFSLIHL